MKLHLVSSALIPSKTLSWGSKKLYMTLSCAFGYQTSSNLDVITKMLDIFQSMLDFLYAKCFLIDMMRGLGKLGQKYRMAPRAIRIRAKYRTVTLHILFYKTLGR